MAQKMDKERFIELCKSGDEYALGLLYTTYAPRLKKLCLRYVGDESVAEDVLHDGFIIIMSSIHQLKDTRKLDSWMVAIMRNLAIRHLGKSGKAIFVPIEEVEEIEELGSETIEIVSEYKELLRLVETLPDGYKSVFKLSVFDGMSHKEIGKLLGINPHSSSSQLARAKEMLRTIVTEYGFVPIVIIALLYATRLDEPKYSPVKTITKSDVEREEETLHTNSTMAQKTYMVKAIPSAPAMDIPTKVDTTTVQKTDSAKEEKTIVLPSISGGNIADNDYYPKAKKREENSWYASVSYSGGTEASNSVISTQPNAGSDIASEETVETKTHHYMPFVVSLSLQKAINDRLSLGTGLRYTRLKTDITTIGSYETTTETQTVEYVGIPLSVNYHLWRTGNLSLYTSAGIAADIPISGNKTWQWSLTVGAGLQYQLAPNVSMFAEPSLNYHLNSSHGTPTIRTDRPFDITIPLGLRLSW